MEEFLAQASQPEELPDDRFSVKSSEEGDSSLGTRACQEFKDDVIELSFSMLQLWVKGGLRKRAMTGLAQEPLHTSFV